MGTDRQRDDRGRDRLTVEEGADGEPLFLGMTAFVIVVAAVGVGAVLAADGPLTQLVHEDGRSVSVGVGEVVGWTFYRAHGVPLSVTDGWMVTGGGLPTPLLHLVPPAVLLLVGGIAVRERGSDSPREAAHTGGSLAVGYGVLSAAGLLVTTYGVESSWVSVRIAPDYPLAILAGLTYPLVFGTIGGLVAYAVGVSTSGET